MRECAPAYSSRGVCALCDSAEEEKGERQRVKQNRPNNDLKSDLKEALKIGLTSRWGLAYRRLTGLHLYWGHRMKPFFHIFALLYLYCLKHRRHF
jgi:hypothetical protein